MLVAGALLGALLVAELGLRGIAWATGQDRAMVFDAVVGWRTRAGVERIGSGWSDAQPGTTNSHGWRDAEHRYGRQGSERRLLALGDSFVFGQNVDYGDRFTELLEGPTTEVVTIAVPAWGPGQQLLAFETWGQRYRPDVVLWVICLANDLDDIRADRKAGWSKPYFTLRGDELVHHGPRDDWLVRLRGASYLTELVAQFCERGRPAKTYPDGHETMDPLPLFRGVARRLASAVQSSGAKLLAVTIDVAPSAGSSVANTDRVLRALADLDIAALSLRPAFEPHEGRWSDLWLPCGHWSGSGHALVARAVTAELHRRGW